MHMGILDIYFENEQKRWVKSRIRGANSIFFGLRCYGYGPCTCNFYVRSVFL